MARHLHCLDLQPPLSLDLASRAVRRILSVKQTMLYPSRISKSGRRVAQTIRQALDQHRPMLKDHSKRRDLPWQLRPQLYQCHIEAQVKLDKTLHHPQHLAAILPRLHRRRDPMRKSWLEPRRRQKPQSLPWGLSDTDQRKRWAWRRRFYCRKRAWKRSQALIQKMGFAEVSPRTWPGLNRLPKQVPRTTLNLVPAGKPSHRLHIEERQLQSNRSPLTKAPWNQPRL